MPRYVFHLELIATRVDEGGGRELKPGDDPVNAVAGAFLKTIGGGPTNPPGVTLRKSFPVTAESFAALCELLGRFDDLAERVECEHP